ncbi:MAG: hypothetical protein US30_C0003G0026 [Candidatus Moranbacteria bacterium GW2011_GWF2_36_839]|nr:MAG: hypothetical protein US27_C0004G0026 [Candidatus Moranbacteria bacterium GW2011_GWF1_36_78]KKQ17459.1 MAG: hypothetical protein US30_C0003G0026 [Candidatus Moranbacteria bacterium GW2011_GWF2_36_839]HAT73926.1 hypothetical protein [Candidatus Moranbacteria bacterium]HBY10548.1 hypothetical protein [Candidatus Moranbacteria bacterium]
MKTALIIFTWLILFCNSVQVQAETKKEWGGSFSMMYQQRYIAIKTSKNVYDFPMLWGNLNLNHQSSGLFTNFWWSESFRGSFDSERGNEFEPTIGWKKPLDKFYAELSATLYNIHFNNWDSNPWILTTKFGKEINPSLKCELWAEWMSPISHFRDGATVLTINLPYIYKEPFGFERLALLFNNLIVWDDGFGADDPHGIFLRQYYGAEYKALSDLALFGGITPLWKLTKTTDGRKNEHTYSFGVKYSF